MQDLNCLIVEDEPLAADVIRDYVMQVPALKLKGICENAFQAMEKLRTEKIDLIFLDINLPKLSGLDFIKTLKNNYHIILTTAYHQYALESYELNVTDYLLKPVEFTRFIQAINKVLAAKGQLPSLPDERKYLFFNVDKKRIKVFSEDITYIEGLKDYIRVHTTNKSLVTKLPLSEAENLLEPGRFLRIHKSFIINLSKISAFTSSEIDLGGIKLKIGRTYKKIVESAFKNLAQI